MKTFFTELYTHKPTTSVENSLRKKTNEDSIR